LITGRVYRESSKRSYIKGLQGVRIEGFLGKKCLNREGLQGVHIEGFHCKRCLDFREGLQGVHIETVKP
jgi:hypothetical protein